MKNISVFAGWEKLQFNFDSPGNLARDTGQLAVAGLEEGFKGAIVFASFLLKCFHAFTLPT